MSRMGELDQQKKEAIDKLKGERLELVEKNRGEIIDYIFFRNQEKIRIIDDQIAKINQTN